MQRRDLTAAQRAIAVARALEQMPERRGRPGKDGGTHHVNGLSRESVAKVFKVGVNAVQQAKAILAEAPDLAARVEACTISLAAAYEELQGRRAQAKQKSKDAERIAEYADAISSGEMTFEEAMQKAIEQEREVLVMREARDPLLYVERRDYIHALRLTIAGVENARVALAGALQRLEL